MPEAAHKLTRASGPVPIETIVTIDDDDLEQMLTKRVLMRSGLVSNIIQFRSAEVALEYLQQADRGPIDVILLDINMPRMNGFEFLEEAVATCGLDCVGCVVVMLTTSLDPADKARAARFDIVKDYISKPLTLDDLPRLSALVNVP